MESPNGSCSVDPPGRLPRAPARQMLTAEQKDRVLRFIQNLDAKASEEFTFRDVVRALDLDSDDRRALQRFLDWLDAEGVIRRVRRRRYSIAERKTHVSGILNRHRDGYGFVLADDRSRYAEDIFIPARNMEDALHEDRVLAEVRHKPLAPPRGRRAARRAGGARTENGEDRKRLEGRVIRVLERKHPVVVGRYRAHSRFPCVQPLDARISDDIRVSPKEGMEPRDGQIVAAAITLPPGRNRLPQGKILEILGDPGEAGIEYRIVEHKYGLPVAFPPEALEEAEALPDRVREEECRDREDFRAESAVTIDGESAHDFDDAVSLRKLESGNWLLGVHIADVSHYVREGSELDAAAYARGTSVYFPDRSIPMLPPKLSSGICSLKPDVDRLVLSALVEVTPRGRVVARRFTRGVIHSRARLTYTTVAAILRDRDPALRAHHAGLVPMLEDMLQVCRALERKRHARGAVDFDLPEADIRFDADGRMTDIVPSERTLAHRIIEEFMLLANECVARELTASGGPALYRIHEKPDPRKVEEFAEFAQALGHRLERSGKEYTPGDFQQFVRGLRGRAEQKFLIHLMLRSFMQARYAPENAGHFGLALEVYTHFTSPIRRYPDLLVHRLLKRILDRKESEGWNERLARRLPEIARHASERERNADEAEREIERIKKTQFMAERVGEEFDAVVSSPSSQGFFVELLDPFVEGFVPAETLIDDRYRYLQKTRTHVGERRRRRYELGSRVRVRLDHADLETSRLTFSVTGVR